MVCMNYFEMDKFINLPHQYNIKIVTLNIHIDKQLIQSK